MPGGLGVLGAARLTPEQFGEAIRAIKAQTDQPFGVNFPWPLQSLAAEDLYGAAQARGEADYFPLLAGQGLRMLKGGQSSAEIVKEVVTEAQAVLSRLHSMAG